MLEARKALNEPLCESDFLWPSHVPVFFCLCRTMASTVGRPKHPGEEGGPKASCCNGTRTANHIRQEGLWNKRSPACVVVDTDGCHGIMGISFRRCDSCALRQPPVESVIKKTLAK